MVHFSPFQGKQLLDTFSRLMSANVRNLPQKRSFGVENEHFYPFSANGKHCVPSNLSSSFWEPSEPCQIFAKRGSLGAFVAGREAKPRSEPESVAKTQPRGSARVRRACARARRACLGVDEVAKPRQRAFRGHRAPTICYERPLASLTLSRYT